MGTEGSSNGINNKEILQTEYNNTTYDKEYNFSDINYKFDIKKINKNPKNNQRQLFFGKQNKVINKPKSLTNIFLLEEKKKIKKKNFITKEKPKEKEKEKLLTVKIDLSAINNKANDDISLDYFKCISCPMCILIQINTKNNRVKIRCENGHENEMNIDSFISIYQIFKYTCDKCKKELPTKYYYCNKCKELFCDSCMKKNYNKEINKGHIFMNKTEINFYCDKHKKRFNNFCKNCQKNCCKKCCIEHSSHELLLIKNEIRDSDYISKVEKMIIKEKKIIDEIEEKCPIAIFKNKNPILLKSFNRLISLRKKENQLKNKILKLYTEYLTEMKKILNGNNTSTNLDNSLSNISNTTSIGDYTNNFLMNFYFLKSVNELENELISNINDFFNFSEDNKYFNDFSDLKDFLCNYRKNIISPEKSLENISKFYTIKKKPNYIFPLDDGNFIIAYDTQIIFYNGLYGDELLIIDEEIFDYTYRIIKLPDGTLLFFGDFLNHIKIDENGSIKVLFTGSHIENLKEAILNENNLIFIDRITQKLKILTNKDINWHIEIFSEYNPNKSYKEKNNEENININKSMVINSKDDTIIKRNKDDGNKLNDSFMTMNDCKDAEKLFINSIKNMRQNKKDKINGKIKDTNNLNYLIKSFDILSINENQFITFQEKSLQNKEACLRLFEFDKDNYKFNIVEEINLEETPLKKNDTLYLIKSNYLGYGTNNKKHFIVYDLNKRMNIAKINLNYSSYKFFGNILLFQYKDELIQYIVNEEEFIFIAKLPFKGIIFSVNYLKNFSLVLDDNKFIYLYSFKKGNENF